MGIRMKVTSPIMFGGKLIVAGEHIEVESRQDAKHLENRGKAEPIDKPQRGKKGAK